MGKLGRQVEVARRKAARKRVKDTPLDDADEGESVSEVDAPNGAESKPSDAIKPKEKPVEMPVLPENPTRRQMQEYAAEKSRLCLFTPATAYASRMHRSNHKRTLSTADKKLRARVLRALRIFGTDTEITPETKNGCLLIRVLADKPLLERLGIQINTKGGEVESAEGIEGSDVRDEEITDPAIMAQPATQEPMITLTMPQRGALTLARAAFDRMVVLTNKGRGQWCASDQKPMSIGDESNCTGTRTINSLVKLGLLATDEDLGMAPEDCLPTPSVHLTEAGRLFGIL